MSFDDANSFTLGQPSEIYRVLSKEIDQLIAKMQVKYDNEAVQKAQASSQNVLTVFYNKVSTEIERLEEYAEWSKFNFAFFGETNAGKSTIIECLRIFLNEDSKSSQQMLFKSKQAELNLSEDYISALDDQISSLDFQISEVIEEISTKKISYDKDNQILKSKKSELESFVSERKSFFTWWQKIIFIFLRLKEEKEIYSLNVQVKSCAVKQENLINLLKEKQQKFHTEKQQKLAYREDFCRKIIELDIYADGSIIGDGRSDYTKKVQNFNFVINRQSVVMLDVPGIEGKESMVEAEIAKSVKKSHAVFYVTSKDAPPNEGTLERVKSYLGDQIEVWSIYNKQVTNPRALKVGLINADDQEALLGLDKVMCSALGQKNYKGHIVLAGLPAFFALATCFVPLSEQRMQQRKFLDSKGVEGLLELSNFSEFHQLLVRDVVNDIDFKVKRANFNKANFLLKKGIEELKSINKDHYGPLKIELEKIFVNASREVDNNLDSLKAAFSSNYQGAIDDFKSFTRSKIYERIDQKIDNKEFKGIFESLLQSQLEALQISLQEKNKNSLAEFEDDTQLAIRKLQSRIELAVKSQQHNSVVKDISLDLDLKIDSGVNKRGLVGTAIGVAAAIMWWNPVGWVLGILTISGIVISFAKAIWSVFDSDYRKSQQRKNVDSNLSRVSDKVQNSMREGLDSFMPKVESELEMLKVALKKPVQYVSDVSADLDRAAEQFDRLSNTISQQYGE